MMKHSTTTQPQGQGWKRRMSRALGALVLAGSALALTVSAAAAAGPACVIQRPYGWHAYSEAGGRSCAETVRGTLTMSPGQSFTMFSNFLVGRGSVTVVCHTNGDGRWDEIDKTCVPGGGGGGGGGGGQP
jgi:hypothetical protein